MKCNKAGKIDEQEAVTVLGCKVVHRRTHILSLAVPASFESVEEDEEEEGGWRAE